MSLLPLSFYANFAISMFAQQLSVQDVIYTTVNGIDQQSTPTSRTITAAIDPMAGKKLEQIFGGAVTDATVMIYTAATLYFVDLFVSGETRKQSFVTYAGTQYRVIQNADWTAQAGIFVYAADRHITQDKI